MQSISASELAAINTLQQAAAAAIGQNAVVSGQQSAGNKVGL